MESQSSSNAVAAAYVLAAFALIGWLILLPGLASLDSSDAAGNGMAQAFTALEAIALWLLLAILTLQCLAKGRAPAWAAFAAVLLVPGSGVAAFGALELLAQPQLSPCLWPIAALAAPPPLQWLAGHGCDAEAELGEAEQVVRAYQDSPERQALLANLAALRRP